MASPLLLLLLLLPVALARAWEPPPLVKMAAGDAAVLEAWRWGVSVAMAVPGVTPGHGEGDDEEVEDDDDEEDDEPSAVGAFFVKKDEMDRVPFVAEVAVA